MTTPTAQMRCLSPERAAALAERLQTESGVPAYLASSNGRMLRAPINDPGFALMLAAVAVEGGYADEQDVMVFQQAAITRAESESGREMPVEERTVVLFCDECGAEIRELVEGAGSAERLAAIRATASDRGWTIRPGTDLCPDCAPAPDTRETLADLLGNVTVRFWVCPVDEHRERPGVQTVQWSDGIAYCTADGCPNTSGGAVTG